MRVFLNSLTFVYIGDVQFYLTSPRGTKILMADAFTSTGLTWYDQWPFLCVGFWGEDPNGTWTLEVVNQVHQVRPNATSNFILKSWTLELRGSRPHSYPVLDTCRGNMMGVWMLYHQRDLKKPWLALCLGPSTFLLLNRTVNTNRAHVPPGGGFQSSTGGVTTRYRALRFDPATMLVDICDKGQAVSNGHISGRSTIDSVHVGVALDCTGSKEPTGRATVDLRDTPFSVAGAQFAPFGDSAVGEAIPWSDQYIEVWGGGNCGGYRPSATPRGHLQNPEATPSAHSPYHPGITSFPSALPTPTVHSTTGRLSSHSAIQP